MQWQGDSGGGRARKQLPPKVRSRTLIGTTPTQAGHEPANELAVLTVTGSASATDPEDLLRTPLAIPVPGHQPSDSSTAAAPVLATFLP